MNNKPTNLKAAAQQFVFGLVLLIVGGVPLGIVAGLVAAVAVATYRITITMF